MRIVFICGSIEPGKDGVGDYTRRLAGEMIRQGHTASFLSINDKYVTISCEEVQDDCGTKVQTLRLPSNKNYSQKIESAKDFIESINPDWLSLQYVPFSFHPKGLHFGLAGMLSKIGKGRKWHIMFHETWVGISAISPIKLKVLGYFQKEIVKSLFSRLHPALVTTTNKLYQIVLSKALIDSTILPLFSNITYFPCPKKYRYDFIQRIYLTQSNTLNPYLFVFFGNIYPDSKIYESITDVLKKIGFNRRLLVIGIGRCTIQGIGYFELLKNRNIPNLDLLHLGELPENEISWILQSCDIAFSCTPFDYIGKSSALASYRRHGLQVIVNRDKSMPEYSKLIENYNQGILLKPSDEWDVKNVASKFLDLVHI